MNRLDTLKFGIAVGITVATLNVACAIALAISADSTIAVFNSFVHGVDLTRLISATPVTLGQIVAGAISVGTIGFAAGALCAACYNLLTHRNERARLSISRRSS